MLRIGEFSRVTQLSIRVLRHYDEIGLLTPARVDASSGHRYYAVEQLAEANRIVALKSLGLSLEQIRKLLAGTLSAEEITGMMRLERARAERARDDAQRRIRDLDLHLDQLTDLGAVSEIEIIVKRVPATSYLGYRHTAAGLDDAVALMDAVASAGAAAGITAPLTVVLHDPHFDTESLDVEVGYPISAPARLQVAHGVHLTPGLLPGVERMASVTHLASLPEAHAQSYHALGLWLDRHGCQFAGPGREIMHGPGRAAAEPTVEIQFPVTATGDAG